MFSQPLSYNTFHVFSPGGRMTFSYGGRRSGFFAVLSAAPSLNFEAPFRPAGPPFQLVRGVTVWLVLGAQWRT